MAGPTGMKYDHIARELRFRQGFRVPPHLPGFKHKRTQMKALGATMWFFIFYRAREGGPKLLDLKHPWEGHAHGHQEEGMSHH